MAFFRGEEGSVKFKNGSGTTEAIVSTTGWTLDTTKEMSSAEKARFKREKTGSAKIKYQHRRKKTNKKKK